MLDPVLIDIKNEIAFVTLNRPNKHNALNMAMFTAIDNATKRLRKDKSIRAVIVNGEGVDFCTGLDVKSVMSSGANAAKLLFKWLPGQSNLAQRVSSAWRKVPVPVIMVLHGRVWGGGLQIALGGDFRIASPNTSFSIMEAKWGLIPDMGGTLAFKEQMPVDQAKLFAMTGQEISSDLALSYQLITETSEDPMSRALELANNFKRQSPDALAGVKRLYNNAWSKSQRFALAKESWYQIKVMFSKNQRIKSYNQINPDNTKPFNKRGSW